ncbi:hypothetical protein F2Q70_00043045 [Brassica cretica]|uniref:Uncharacterized protein n=1 Tax=Brassica cretica TaxID=69181 RepID=A0A8S9KG08_BRACR|nr:hypothetical protein F2Q70_00043045 [Brassica cretica]
MWPQVKKPQTSSRRINDPRIIAACHCGAEYETDYSASIDSLPVPSIDNTQDISIDITIEESVDSSQREWESDYYNPAMAVHTMHTEEYDEDYEEEHAIEQKAILDEEDRLLHHSSWKKKSPSIDRDVSTSIDTQLHQPASTDITYYQSIDTNIDYAQDGHYSIGSWADDRYHESFAVEISYRDQGDDELHEAAWERTRFSHPFDRASRPSIDIDHITSIDIRPKPKTTVSAKPKFDNQYLTPDEFGIFRDLDGYAKAIDGRTLHVSREDIADILQTANGADNLFVQQHKIPENQQKVAKEFHDTIGGIDKCFKEKKFYWEEKDEYGIYRNDQGYARDVDGHTIRVHNNDIRRFLERSSRDEPNYICPPKHASSFTQTKLVPEIYTKDEINEMFYGVYGEQEKNKGDFRMKLDGVYYALNDIKKPQTSSRRINDPRIIAACHCGAEYETDYSASIDNLPVPSIDNTQDISIDITTKESVDSSQREWESDYYNPAMAVHTMHTEEYDEDYEEEQAIEQKAILDEEDRLLHHSSWKKKSPSIDRDVSTSIDTQLHQPNRLRASTDIPYYQSIDTNIDYARDGDYSIGSWADDRYHESFAVETSYRDQGDDELPEEAAWERTRFSHPFDRASRPSIDIDHITSIDIRPKPKTTVSGKPKFDNQYLTPDEFGIFRDQDGYAKAIDGRTLHVSREDIADILRTANGADNLFVQQHKIPENQQKVAKEFHDTTGGIDKCFKEKKFYWEEKDEYEIYRNNQGYARDVDGHTIRVHNNDIRRFLERASRDEPNYICPPEHASSFTQTKLVPEIYTKDEINEMFYGVYGEQEKNKGDFWMKLDGVYYALNDSISW